MGRSGWSMFRTEMNKRKEVDQSLTLGDMGKMWRGLSSDARLEYKALAADDNKRTEAAAARVRAECMTRSRTHKVHVSSPLSKDISSALQAAEADSDSDAESFCSRTSCAPCSSFVKPSRGPFPPATALPAPFPVLPANMTTEQAARFLCDFYHGSTEPPEGLQDDLMIGVSDFVETDPDESHVEPHSQFGMITAWAEDWVQTP